LTAFDWNVRHISLLKIKNKIKTTYLRMPLPITVPCSAVELPEVTGSTRLAVCLP
jgi:hypothetical protein